MSHESPAMTPLILRPLTGRDFVRLLAWPPLAAFAFGALVTLLLGAALHVNIDRSGWHLDLALRWRLGVLGWSVVQALPLAAGAGLLVAAAAAFRPRLAAIAAGVLLALGYLVVFASWGMFWLMGYFLDADAVRFGLASPGPLLAHALEFSPVMVAGVPLAAALAGAGLAAAGRWSGRVAPGIRAALLPLLLVVWGSAWAGDRDSEFALGSLQRVIHPEQKIGVALGELLVELREERSGPVAWVAASRRRSALQAEISPRIAVEWRQQSEAYPATEPAQRYNVVLLIVESLRSDELEAYGGTLDVMPAVDALARESAVYLDHHAVASHSSYSSVTPVSSQYPLRDARLHIYPVDPVYPRVRLYDILWPLGYRTAIISSQNERWGGMANFLASDRIDHFFHAETFKGPTYVPDEDTGFAQFSDTYGHAGKIDDRYTIDEAISWIGTDAGRPFFVYINLQNSHVPYPVPPEAPVPFGPRTTSFPIRFNHFPQDSADVVRGVYRNALHYVDAQVGRLFTHLRQAGMWDRTIVAVMGDHGQAFYEHGFAAHANALYEELLRTPLVIRAPGLEPGPRSGLAQHVDVAPTILELLGLPPHPGFQGASLLSARRSFAYATVQSPIAHQYSISQARWKLVLDGRRGGLALRDLDADPHELQDWSGEHPDRAAELLERLQTWRGAQLRYYGSPLLQTTGYAPVLPDPPRLAAGPRRRPPTSP